MDLCEVPFYDGRTNWAYQPLANLASSKSGKKDTVNYYTIEGKNSSEYITFRFKYDEKAFEGTDDEGLCGDLGTVLLMIREYLSGAEFCLTGSGKHTLILQLDLQGNVWAEQQLKDFEFDKRRFLDEENGYQSPRAEIVGFV